MGSKQEHKEYIQTHIHNLFQDLVNAALNQKPNNLQKFILEFLLEYSGEALSPAQKEQLKQLRLQKQQLVSGNQSNTDESEDSEQDYLEELPMPSKNKLSTARVSVSAEAFGEWNKRQEYIPRVFPKTSQQTERIQTRLQKAFMFQALEANEKEIVINAMEERKFAAGEFVIQQNDDGNELFLVDSGKLECWKLFPNDPEAKLVKNYGEGESFGELALLYNCPRAASIKTVTDCVCWVLDRECFNHIVKDAAMRKREKYEEFLASVSIFEEMENYERSQIADALQSVSFANGEYVIREGDWGDFFYMIEEGTAVAMKTLTPGCPAQEVKQYHPGDYFGELSLLKGEPRAASILTTSPLKCVTLGRKAFKRMIGPLEDILRRNAGKYQGYLYG